MAFKPILFSTPMVEAILKGRKTQTRRIIKYSKNIQDPKIGWSLLCDKDQFEVRGIHESGEYGLSFFKMPIIKDDILWVRETWATENQDSNAFLYHQKYLDEWKKGDPKIKGWKPSIFMPLAAARIFLKIKKIKIEKLLDISDADAKSEGIEIIDHWYWKDGAFNYMWGEDRGNRHEYFFLDGNYGMQGIPDHNGIKASFFSLWASINKWESVIENPWVWVYEFEVLKTKPGICISCGCTDSNCKSCIEKTGAPCSWVNADHTVCSACKSQKS